MPKNRAKAEAFLLEHVEAILPESGNRDEYIKKFAAMSDKQFDDFIQRLRTLEEELTLIVPNRLANTKGPNGKPYPVLSVERNLALGDKLGHEFFQRIWMNPGNGSPKYLTPIRYLVTDQVLRRQAQLLEKKISIPEDNTVVDDLTGQPTGKSKGSKISYPEVQILAANGLEKSLYELMTVRGGDNVAFDAMNASISRTGGASLTSISKLGSQVKSTQTLATYLLMMHLQNTLGAGK